MYRPIFIFLTIAILLAKSAIPTLSPFAVTPDKVLATHSFSLEKRYNDTFVNNVFRDNILLTIDYLEGKAKPTPTVDWNNVVKPFQYRMVLKPGETFAFHDDVLPKYSGKVNMTTNAHFNSQEGFKSDGYLVGDGVCHLASLIYWVAKDAGLDTYAPVRHDFAIVPEVPREYGVSIYATPGVDANDQQQNLYITNNKDKNVAFEFVYDGSDLKISATEAI